MQKVIDWHKRKAWFELECEKRYHKDVGVACEQARRKNELRNWLQEFAEMTPDDYGTHQCPKNVWRNKRKFVPPRRRNNRRVRVCRRSGNGVWPLVRAILV
jgi:hypothetical protein